MLLVVSLLLLADPAPAYRVGTATNRVAILPVQCERDLEPSFCKALGESMAVEIGHDPRVEAMNPRDFEVLAGAQTVADLSTCERDDCYGRADFTRIDASYLLALSVSRIGKDARLTLRLVDLKRGTVIDRDQVGAPVEDEQAIDRAARSLAWALMVRRGLVNADSVPVEEDRSLRPVFWAGAVSGVLGLAAGGTVGFLGFNATSQALLLQADPHGLSDVEFQKAKQGAQLQAVSADVLGGVGAALLLVGAGMMVVGSL